MQLLEGELKKSVEQRVHRLGSDPLRQGRRIGDVAEQHRNLLALALRRAADGCDLLRQVGLGVASGRRERSRRHLLPETAAALAAEPRICRMHCPACSASRT